MAYVDVRFPEDISYGSSGGPEFRTTVVELWSGHEQRNMDWSYPRHKYNIKYGLKEWADVQTVLDFFWAMGGRAHSFRFRDRFDWWSGPSGVSGASNVQWTDQNLGAPGAATQQLAKKYTQGAVTLTRTIINPISGTVKVGWSGAEKSEGPDWTMDYDTGIITYVSGDPGVAVSSGFEFDVRVRFMEDYFPTTWVNLGVMDSDVFLVEVRGT